MKIGAIIPSYRMTYYLKFILQTLSDIDKVLVLNSSTNWEEFDPLQYDNTEEIVSKLYMLSNIELIKGEWKEQTEQRNYGLKKLFDEGFDYVWVLDSDEFITPENRNQIIDHMERYKDLFKYVCINIKQYCIDLYHEIDYDTGHHPLVLCKKGHFLRDKRCAEDGKILTITNIFLHHLKFLQPESDVDWRCHHKFETRLLNKDKILETNNFIISYFRKYDCRLPKEVINIRNVLRA